MVETRSRSNPFPGLRPFTSDEDYLFFGREDQVKELLRRLRQTRFLAVVGTSGSGKSSLVQAGLLPALHGGLMADAGSSWRIASFRPGGDPIGALARALNQPAGLDTSHNAETDAALRVTLTETILRRSTLGLVEVVRQARLPARENLLVVVDQFEELFRFKDTRRGQRGSDESAAFVKLLLEASHTMTSSIYIVLTMRSDFLGDCAQFRDLPEAINDGQFLIPSLTRDQVRQAIEGPVAVGGAKMASRLVQRLLNDVGDNPDYLPILQHALMRSWDKWRDGPCAEVDLPHYEAIGMMTTALSQHAEEVYAELPDERSRAIAEKLFKALTDKSVDNRGVRRPTRLDELCAVASAMEAEVVAIIETFRQPSCSFLMPPGGVPLKADSVVDISHESLMRVWERLKTWVEEEAESARMYRRLAETAVLYEVKQAGLWRDPDLQLALNWRDQNQPNAAWAAPYHFAFGPAMRFLEDSRAAREAELTRQEAEAHRQRQVEQEQQQRELAQAQALAEVEQQRAEVQAKAAKRLRQLAAILALVALVAIGLTIYAVQQTRTAETGRKQSERLRRISIAQALAAQALHQREWHKDERDALLARQAYLYNQQHQGHVLNYVDNALRNVLSTPYFSHILGHQTPVTSIAFSPDGQHLASASEGKTVRLWDLRHPQTSPIVLSGHEDPVLSVAFSPDGQRLASSSADKTVRLWDLRQLEASPMVLKGHEEPVTSVAFSPDGQRLASASEDNTVRLWDLRQSQVPSMVRYHDDWVKSVTFSPDGQRLASGSADKTVRLWDLHQPEAPAIVLPHDDWVRSVAFSPDGQRLASGSADKTVRLWDLHQLEASPIVLRSSDKVRSVAFSPDGQRLASGNELLTVWLWDLRQLEAPPVVLRGHEDTVVSVAFSSDGQHLASGSSDTTVRLWDLRPPEASLNIPRHEDTVMSVAFSPDGQHVASGSIDATVRLWDLHRLEASPIVLSGHEELVMSVAFSSDGQRLASGSADKTVQLWDLHQLEAPATVLRGHEEPVMSVAFSPDGQRLASGSADKTVQLWDLHQLEAPATVLRGHEEPVMSVAFSPDGQRLASGGQDKTVRLWDLGQPQTPLTILRHEGWVMSVAFSPDGQRLASGSADKTVQLWDLRQPQAPLTILRHEGWVVSVAFSPDGQRLASGSADKTVQLWDLRQPQAPLTILRHEEPVVSVAFSPDGQRLALGSLEGTIRIWVAHTESLANMVCEKAWRNLTLVEWHQFVSPDILYERTCPNLPSGVGASRAMPAPS